MDFAKSVEIGAPDNFVDGIASMELIGDTVRVNFYCCYGGENRTVLSVRWSLNAWKDACAQYSQFFASIRQPAKVVSEIRIDAPAVSAAVN